MSSNIKKQHCKVMFCNKFHILNDVFLVFHSRIYLPKVSALGTYMTDGVSDTRDSEK